MIPFETAIDPDRQPNSQENEMPYFQDESKEGCIEQFYKFSSFFLPLVLTEKEIIIISIAELISFHSGKATQYYHYII